MTTIICPKCGTENSMNAMNCRSCRINLKFALEHPEEIERPKKKEAHQRKAQEPAKLPDRAFVTILKRLAGVLIGIVLIYAAIDSLGSGYASPAFCGLIVLGIGVICVSLWPDLLDNLRQR